MSQGKLLSESQDPEIMATNLRKVLNVPKKIVSEIESNVC